MRWYPWLTDLYKRILLSYKQGKGHHALLLHSCRGNGISVLIYAISRWLICKNPNSNKSCHTCRDCTLMQINNHPDYYCLAPTSKYSSIGVENIRELVHTLYECAHRKGVKVISLAYSECLTDQAVNALLKIIEEPPIDTYFLLGCYNYAHLLPTLKSRCCHWFLSPPCEEQGLNWLQKNRIVNILHASTALRLCNGAPLAAQDLLNSKDWQLRLDLCKSMFNVITKHNFFNLLSLFCDQNNDDIVCWLISLLVDALKWQFKMQDLLINVDQTKLIASLACNWSSQILNGQLKKWIQYRQCLHDMSGVNKELLLAHQLLSCEQQIDSLYFN
ncbi:DNA polymerase III subunit delta' [Blochmannia endosymbiont of Colobopsis nipponica]|uniref:DNA polymerase III subunit delta' C-terminal domain-containing protein n=1 Tax=Blochmannia endosymbiont of Colobopsis nipponica TaxID=2681987 RepID=UPI0017873D21|nr:DNA polymerase III subunit delta' C-terminal domain-containing protein [Blochmannia endosymbiont of Colobopsis nipponica]QOI11052.1 DNA polymerase III subunit delta' [Blochmannia endosymbiont of Colobopsis nipponica]